MPSMYEIIRLPGQLNRTTWITDQGPYYNSETGNWVPARGHYLFETIHTNRGYELRERTSSRSSRSGSKYIRSQPYYFREVISTDWHGWRAEGYEPSQIWEVRRSMHVSGEGLGGPFTQPECYGWDKGKLMSLEELVAKASNSLLSKVASQDVNLGNAIGERKQTYDLITSAARTIVHGLRDLKSGRLAKDVIQGMFERTNYVAGWVPPSSLPRRERRYRQKVAQRRREEGIATAKSDMRRAAQAALVFDYGIRPLMDDIHGASEGFRRRFLEGQQEIVSVRSSAKDQDITSFVYHDSAIHVQGDGVIDRSARMGVKFRVSNPILRDLQQLGLVNPVSIAWEVTPWSFVVDWFVGVGNFIELQTATAGLSFVDGYTTTREAYTGSCTSVRCGKSGQSYDSNNLSRSDRTVEIRRTPLVGFPAPSLLKGKGIHSETRAREALSLAITNLKFFK